MSALLFRVILIFIFLCWITLLQTLAQPPADPAVKLEFNQVIKREFSQAGSHTYELLLSKGQCLEVTAVSNESLIGLILWSSEGVTLVRHEPFAFPEKSRIVFLVEQTAVYKLTVATQEGLLNPNCHYELIAKIIAKPSANDLSYFKMLQLQNKFWPLLSQGTTESLNELIVVGTELVNIARSLGNRQFEGLGLTDLAEAHKAKEEYALALNYFKQLLVIAREWRVPSRTAGVLTPMGQIYYAWGDYPHALECYLEALSMVKDSVDNNIIGWNLTNIGHVYFAYGELNKAIPYYQQAYEQYGRYTGLSSSEMPLGQGIALAGMANVFSALGEKQKAIDLLKESLVHIKSTNQAEYENILLVRLGDTYTALGDYVQAETLLERASQYFRNSNGQYEATALSSRGNLAKLQGNHIKALNYLQNALTIRRNLKDKRGSAQILTNIGAVYALQGNLQNALNQYSEAQLLWQEIGDKYNEGCTLNYLGQAYAELKHATEARGNLTKALALRLATNDREGEANTRYQLARLDFAAHNFRAARQQIEITLAIIESVRATVDSQELRASFLSTVQEYYEFYIDLLMQMHGGNTAAGYDAEAYKISEMSRARSLIETLAETRGQLRQGVAPELIKRELDLQQRLNAKADYQQKLIGKKAQPELIRVAEQEVQAIASDLQDTRARIKSSSPHYADLSQTQPITVSQIQQSLLDENTILLSYALGKERSYVWAISKNQCNSYELPKREIIEVAARRVYELLTRQDFRSSKTANDLSPINKALLELSNLIIEPTKENLGQKRLLVVADGALQYIPFGALPAPKIGNQNAEVRSKPKPFPSRLLTPDARLPLIYDHEIVNLPSATTLFVIRRELANRKPATKAIAVFADPVFTADDPRLANVTSNNNIKLSSPELEQSLRDVGEDGSKLQRLLFSRREAETIDTLVPDNDRVTALDFSANRSAVMSANLQDFRILHFATHGLLNSVHPELSGLVFSLVDNKGQSQDGFFRLHEIYNLQLNSDLVVLSACQTALGKEVKGEGLISLTRGFMYAGSPRVIASLWKVNDRATAQLMSSFYQEMLSKNKLSAAAALRTAQINLLKQERWAHPRYWAAFTIQGEWE